MTTFSRALTRPRILVIDDEPELLVILAHVISEAGYDVACAGSGPEALKRAQQEHFDLVLSDFKMPGMDGLQTVAALAQLDPAIRPVLMTGFVTAEARAALASRHHPYIEKPFDITSLLETVRHALQDSSSAPPSA